MRHLNNAKKEWKDNQSDNSRSDISSRSIYSNNNVNRFSSAISAGGSQQ